MCPLYVIKGRINNTRGMGLLNKVLQVQCDMKGFSGENIPVKRANGEFLPLAVTLGQYYCLQSLSLPSYGTQMVKQRINSEV